MARNRRILADEWVRSSSTDGHPAAGLRKFQNVAVVPEVLVDSVAAALPEEAEQAVVATWEA